jgi:hypothetical protein
VDLLRARFVGRLLLSLLVAHDALIGAMWGLGLGLWHALLAAMFAALILHAFEIVFLGHREQPLFQHTAIGSVIQCVLVLCHFSKSKSDSVPGFCSFSTGPFQGSSLCFNDFLSVRWRGSSLGFSLLMAVSCPVNPSTRQRLAQPRRSSPERQKARPASIARRA